MGNFLNVACWPTVPPPHRVDQVLGAVVHEEPDDGGQQQLCVVPQGGQQGLPAQWGHLGGDMVDFVLVEREHQKPPGEAGHHCREPARQGLEAGGGQEAGQVEDGMSGKLGKWRMTRAGS